LKFLAINTAGAAVEAALYTDGKTVYKRDAEFKKASAVTLPFVDELLLKAGLKLDNLDFIAVVTGPGSFTGIRIGLTAARAFAQFTGLKIVPVTLCEVLSYNVNAPAETIVALCDAANGFTYIAAFDGETRDELMPPQVLKNEQIDRFLDSIDEPCVVCADKAGELFVSGKTLAPFKTDCSPLVEAVKAVYKKRGAVPYGQVTPLYVRKPQAEEGVQ